MKKKPERGFRRVFQLTFRKSWVAEAVDAEIRHHLEMRIDELVEEGLRPEEARCVAEDALGNWPHYRAECIALQQKEARRMRWMERVASALSDMDYAFRGIRKNPGFAGAVVATLALGIGANTAIFTVVDAVMLHPVPYENPEELYQLGTYYEEQEFSLYYFPWEGARRWWESGLFTELAAHGRVNAVRTDGEAPEAVYVQALSPGLLELFRVSPQLGRPILEEDHRLASPDVVLLGNEYWRTRFGGDPGVLGQSLVLDNRPHTVIGVLPPIFRFPYGRTDLYTALREDGTAMGLEIRQIQLVGRVGTEVDLAVFRQRLEVFAEGNQDVGPSRGDWVPRLDPLNVAPIQAPVKRAMWVVFGSVGLMLLIAVLNGMNLLLARATVRTQEIGVRLALGASRGRVVRQLLLESLLLALMSGGAAVLLATVGVEGLMMVAPRDLSWTEAVPGSLSGRVLGFTFLVTVGTGFALGLVPGLRAVAMADATPGRASSVYSSTSPGSGRLRGALVVAQVALSLSLLFGAALLGRSFARLTGVDPGFDPAGLTFLELNLPDGGYPDTESVFSFGRALMERVSGLPGVTEAALSAGGPPRSGITFGDRLEAQDRDGEFEEGDWIIAYAPVGEGYLATMGTDLLAGRHFQAEDFVEGGRAIIIDPDLATHLWGSTNAVGKRFRLREGPWYEVVGVMEDLKLMGLEDQYTDFAMIRPYTVQDARGFLSVSIRSDADPGSLFPLLRSTVSELDPELPIYQVATATDSLWESLERPRFFLLLMGVFAGVAVLLAAVGIYGVLSFTVGQRTREMGIRVALGAEAGKVRTLVLRGGLRLALAGVVLGVLLSSWASFALEALLFRTAPRDLLSFTVVVLLMIGVSALACLLPAHRATRVDPVEVLKAE